MDPVKEAIKKYPVLLRREGNEVRLSPHGYLYVTWQYRTMIMAPQDVRVLIQLLQDGLREAQKGD